MGLARYYEEPYGSIMLYNLYKGLYIYFEARFLYSSSHDLKLKLLSLYKILAQVKLQTKPHFSSERDIQTVRLPSSNVVQYLFVNKSLQNKFGSTNAVTSSLHR